MAESFVADMMPIGGTERRSITNVVAREGAGYIVGGLLFLLFAGLAGRILAYPVNKDEHLFVTNSAMLGEGELYRELGFNHLPNLPYLLGGIYALFGIEHYLLVGRLLIVAFWALAVFALWLLARRLKVGLLGFAAAAVLLLGNVLILSGPGVLVTNNFAPIPFALLGLYFLVGAMRPDQTSAGSALLAGVFVSLAIGFKANYVFLAPFIAAVTLLAPATRPLLHRLTAAFAPLAMGGVLGGLPTLYKLVRDPEGFLAHVLRYFTELQTAYWSASTEPQVSSVADRVILSEQIWLSNATLLSLVGIGAMLLIPLFLSGRRAFLARFAHWTIILSVALVVCGLVIAFVPTPSFPQYFVPPIPFLIAGFLFVLSRLERVEKVQSLPILAAIVILALVGSATRLLPSIPNLVRPAKWTGIGLHTEARQLATASCVAPGSRVATLSPIMALEAGYRPFTEFAAGPFVYRVAEFIPPADAPYYRTTSPVALASFLDAKGAPPIVLGDADSLEKQLADYANLRGYREVATHEARKNVRVRMLVPSSR